MSKREKKANAKFSIEEQRHLPDTSNFNAVLNPVRLAGTRMSFIVGRRALGTAKRITDSINQQGERKRSLLVKERSLFISDVR